MVRPTENIIKSFGSNILQTQSILSKDKLLHMEVAHPKHIQMELLHYSLKLKSTFSGVTLDQKWFNKAIIPQNSQNNFSGEGLC